jgi:glycosylphosphatidylinositol transamidase
MFPLRTVSSPSSGSTLTLLRFLPFRPLVHMGFMQSEGGPFPSLAGSLLNLLRIVESTLRTCNNLLERLHASFFFYLLPEPGSFAKIGSYLPSAVVISTAILFSGLRSWVRAGWIEVPVRASEGGKAEIGQVMRWERRNRPSLQAVLILLATHVWGVPLYFISTWPILPRLVRILLTLHIRCLTQSLSLALPHYAFQYS